MMRIFLPPCAASCPIPTILKLSPTIKPAPASKCRPNRRRRRSRRRRFSLGMSRICSVNRERDLVKTRTTRATAAANKTSLRRLPARRRRAPCLDQPRPFLAHLGEIAHLHMAVTANLLGQRGERDRERVIVRGQRRHQLPEKRFIFADQRPLLAPLRRMAENVEPGAAQASQRRERAKTLHHPRAEA